MLTALETRLQVLRHQPLDAARHLTGAKVMAARLYGVGPVTALAMTFWLAGAGRFPSVRKAVRFAELDITRLLLRMHAPAGAVPPGPAALRWALWRDLGFGISVC